MENDLISRSALLKKKTRMTEYDETGCGVHVFVVMEEDVLNAPAVDAEPVKHGIWEDDPQVWRCSECQKWLMVLDGDANMNFCTHCGCRMDGRVEGCTGNA